jgi:transcriptional regulator with XRE-family HTH domain
MNKEEKSKISIEIGRRLSEIRRFRKLSQKDIAVVVGRSITHIWNCEKGRTSPTIADMALLTDHLGVQMNYWDHKCESYLDFIDRGVKCYNKAVEETVEETVEEEAEEEVEAEEEAAAEEEEVEDAPTKEPYKAPPQEAYYGYDDDDDDDDDDEL